MKHFVIGKVVGNYEIDRNWFKLDILSPKIALYAMPGQFVQIRIKNCLEPLLSRPFSIAGILDDGSITLLIKKVGNVTRLLSTINVNDEVELVGPLGNMFPEPEVGRRIFIAAGGIGVAPFRFYLQKFKGFDLTLFYGLRNSEGLGILEDMIFNGTKVTVVTEDGSFGSQEFVVDAIYDEIKKCKPDMILACGPIGMLRAMSNLVDKEMVSCKISLESYIGCGFGACMGCAVPVFDSVGGQRYFHVCQDGPVFDSRDIDWKRMEW